MTADVSTHAASRPCLVIAGPTASGKTALAVDVAHALGSEIFSMDSRQVYRGLDLGTGKDLAEYARVSPPVPHHLIDIAEPEEVYSLYRFQYDAYAALEGFFDAPPGGRRTTGDGERGNDAIPPVLVGGTGLYLEAVLRRYALDAIPENPDLRATLMARDAEDLRDELARVDPERFARTDLSSKKRTARALEVALELRARERESGAPLGTTQLPDWTLDPCVCVLRGEREALHARIDARLQARLDAGLIEEVRALQARGLSRERFDLLGMEYRQVAAYLRGEQDHATMVETLRLEIHHLAKRQETWFRGLERRGLPVTWIDVGARAEDVLAVYAAWKRVRNTVPGKATA